MVDAMTRTGPGVLLLFLLIAAVGPTGATAKSCADRPYNDGRVPVSDITTQGLSCKKAHRVAQAYRKKWKPAPHTIRVKVRGLGRFVCKQRQRVKNGQSFVGVRCRHARRPQRVNFRSY